MKESYFEIWNDGDTGGFIVKKFTPDGYPAHSVLAGQTLIQFLSHFESVDAALASYPEATFGSSFTSERNTFDHLSDEEGEY